MRYEQTWGTDSPRASSEVGLSPSSGAALALSPGTRHIGSGAGSLGGICISLALVMSGACLCEVPGAARTKGSRRLGNNKDQGKRKAKF